MMVNHLIQININYVHIFLGVLFHNFTLIFKPIIQANRMIYFYAVQYHLISCVKIVLYRNCNYENDPANLFMQSHMHECSGIKICRTAIDEREWCQEYDCHAYINSSLIEKRRKVLIAVYSFTI